MTESYPGSDYHGGGGEYPAAGGGEYHSGATWTYAPPPAYQGPPSQEPPQRGRSRTVLVAAVTAAVVGGAIGAGTVAAFNDNNNKPTVVSALPQTTQTAPATAKIDGSITAAAAKIQPSVVTIDVSGQNEQGNGSGVIIRQDGYIVTNDHVVSVAANGGTMTVVTNDGQQAKASIVGRDSSDDLAVIKVTGLKNLVPASFAKSSNVIIGQTVIAVGAPLGLSDTVTSGIVSNTARPVRSGDNDQAVFDAIQTDAAINPGNSGGALADLNGNVIGINAAIATPNTGGLQIPGQTQQSGSIGIGFAIPSDEVSRIAAELIASGKATHAFLGVGPTNQQTNNVTGAQIGSVQQNTAAAKAGLKAGDIVTKVDNQRVDDFDGLAAAIRSHVPNQTVTLTIIRGGKTSTLRVTLGSQTG
jgi:putative serine protease PepD